MPSLSLVRGRESLLRPALSVLQSVSLIARRIRIGGFLSSLIGLFGRPGGGVSFRPCR